MEWDGWRDGMAHGVWLMDDGMGWMGGMHACNGWVPA
jgi:hypothetical protein